MKRFDNLPWIYQDLSRVIEMLGDVQANMFNNRDRTELGHNGSEQKTLHEAAALILNIAAHDLVHKTKHGTKSQQTKPQCCFYDNDMFDDSVITVERPALRDEHGELLPEDVEIGDDIVTLTISGFWH